VCLEEIKNAFTVETERRSLSEWLHSSNITIPLETIL
jgi:hypothetical protein